MFCNHCGSALHKPFSFCSACGKPAGNVPLQPVRSRIAGHIRLLGIFWLAFSAFRLIPGAFLLAFSHVGRHLFPPEVPGFVLELLQAIGWVLVGAALLGIAAGWGLLERQPWARMLAIILGCFGLIEPPFGTAIGIYTLWVLLPAASEQEYSQISRAA
jgi:hypothetical protein